MSNPETDRVVKSDEAWKERVRSEAAAEPSPAAESGATAPAGESPANSPARPKIEPHQLPPATLTTLVSMLGTQAMVALGVLADPSTGEAEPQPALARHFIDLLGVLEEKTKENLTIDEQRMLNSTLHELRMVFVQVSGTGGR